MQLIRVFISSPGDVADERLKAAQVIAALQRELDGDFRIEPVLWENLPLGADASFQEGIDLVLNGIEIAVFILWSRLGSPLGAPNKADGTPYRSGTERELDLMLAARKASNGAGPQILVYMRQDDEGWNATLDARKSGTVLKELIEQREAVREFIRQAFHDDAGRNMRAYHTYSEPVAFAQRLHTHLRQLLLKRCSGQGADATWREAPYRSLEVFDVQHAVIFCGRDEETCDLLQRLREQERAGCAFVCIVGASGSGKSSLARAGVAATLLQRSFEDRAQTWRAAFFLPSLGSGQLFRALAEALSEAIPELASGPGGLEQFAKRLQENPEAATDRFGFARHAAEGAKGGILRLLLVIDQMEELWTDPEITPELRAGFFRAIESLAASNHLSVLATLRSDFYPQAQLSEDFLRMKGNRGHFDLTAPGSAALRDLILQPAHRAGLRFERDERTGQTLDQRIFEDALRDAVALPLLEYALDRLYEDRDTSRRLLTFAAYEAMGGVEGALQRRATQILSALPASAQGALVEVLPLLVSVDIAGEQNAVRRRATLATLVGTDDRRRLIEALIEARFLTTQEHSGVAVASFAHEALLRRWDRVTAWVGANRDLLRMRARVEQYQAMWEESGRDSSGLLPAGLPLEDGSRLLASPAPLLDEKAAAFVRLSLARHQEYQRRAARWRTIAATGLSALTVLALAAGAVAWQMKGAAEDQRRVAVTQSSLAREESLKRGQHLEEAARSDRFVAAQELAGGDESAALAHLERALRYVPGSLPTAQEALPILLSSTTEFSRQTLSGHDGFVRSAVFNADATQALTSSDDKTARLWDLRSGHCLREFKGHSEAVKSAALSPDGRRVLTASEDMTARLWDIETGASVAVLTGHTGLIKTAVFSPDGNAVLTASADGTARLWKAESGECRLVLAGHEGIVWSAVFSRDGRKILTASGDHTARVWDAATGAVIAVLRGHANTVRNAVFTNDGNQALTCSWDGTARLWDAATGVCRMTYEGHTNEVRTVCQSPDGTRVLTASWDRTARLWDLKSGVSLLELKGHAGTVWSAVFSPDGRRILTASEDHTARLWDAGSGALIDVYKGHAREVRDAVFSNDGRQVLTISSDSTARLWDAQGGASFAEFYGHTDEVTCTAFSPDGKRVLTASKDHSARLWNPVTGATTAELIGHTGGIRMAVFNPDGRLILTASEDHTARLWEAESGRCRQIFVGHGSSVNAVRFSPDGQHALTAAEDSSTRLWHLQSGAQEREMKGHTDDVLSAVFSPDGKSCLTASWDNTARLWDLHDGRCLVTFRGHADCVITAVFNRDGTRVLTASKDQTARLWETRTGKLLTVFRGHTGEVRSAAFSLDERFVLTASDDQTARLWDAKSGAVVAILAGHADRVTFACFAPDGQSIWTASDDHSARLWSLSGGSPKLELNGHTGGVECLVTSTDGTQVITGSADHTARLWDARTGAQIVEFNGHLRRASTAGAAARAENVPAWLGELLLTISGVRLGENGRPQRFPGSPGPTWSETLVRASQQGGDDPYARILNWRLKLAADRPLDPFDDTPRAAAASAILERPADRRAVEHAYQLAPSHPLVHLALAAFAEMPEQAEFLRRYSLDRLPDDPVLISRAVELLSEQRQQEWALGYVEQAQAQNPDDARAKALGAVLRSSTRAKPGP